MRPSPSNIATRATAGFSLVELMVAITLSLLLLTGVIAIFSSSRVSYETTHQLSRVQETGRFALEQISRHVRSAGFSGCARTPNYVSTALVNPTALQWNFSGAPVFGFNATEAGFTPELDASVQGALAGSDVLVVRGPRLDSEPTLITTDVNDPQDPLVVVNGSIIRDMGDVVMAYNCEAQAFFFATASGNTLAHGVGDGSEPGNALATTSFPFGVDDEVVPVETVVYYVGPSPEASTPGSNPPDRSLPEGTNSLWRRAGVEDAQELVQGIDQMQVEYGLDTNNDRVVDTYAAATGATNWQQVMTVRVALLVRSIDQTGTDTDQRTYQLLNAPAVQRPGDRRLREVFTATISIRSRVRID